MSKLFKPAVTFVLLTVFFFTILSEPLSAQDKISTSQTRTIRKIESGIKRAGKLFENNKQKQSAKLVDDLIEDLAELVKDKPSPALLTAAQQPHALLRQARQALVAAGQTVRSVADLPTVQMDPSAPVSFTREVATILNNQCGNCHVQRTRGQFSMATFQALAAGVGGAPVVVPGKSAESRLIEAIEEGSMPPNGEVPPEQLARLKKWIQDGAVFDGPDNTAPLAGMTPRPPRQNIEISRATGNETVSFALDVAPVLMENCMGCHFEPRNNAQGGLRIDNFRQLLRGGDSGPMLSPGDGANSLLVQRLTATDNTRMPRGRRTLDKAVIEKIVRWIDEGARFDGRQGNMNLRQLSAIAASEAATHDELSETRRGGGLKNWKKVMSNVPAVTEIGKEVLVIGTDDNAMLEEVAEFGDEVSQKIKAHLGIGKNEPLVKGQISIFVFQRRYDYSEFGKMIETRDLPKSWSSHWDYDTVNAYLAVLLTKDQFGKIKPDVTQRLAAVASAALGPDVPDWFADGLGYVVAEQLVGDKKMIKSWQADAAQAAAEMSSPTAFMQGGLANDKSGLVAYAFVRSLREVDSRRFREFLKLLRSGNAFEEAFVASWSATPVELMNQQFGKGSGKNWQGRNRRNRK
ncbi:MAG: hypothetical protein GY819_17255 [Planctomycetaceae bacterium]|nr:hypothetical protein [Planctomycetaceae bacterium]MCP4464544.1 hypothetical protein [Planctomycetaceae bacterium]MDG1809743.1 hypothetical protein [Pirellulaceae bacterium]MDG2102354.1 hypothetical protein [Pirellulaceae bacterium]